MFYAFLGIHRYDGQRGGVKVGVGQGDCAYAAAAVGGEIIDSAIGVGARGVDRADRSSVLCEGAAARL